MIRFNIHQAFWPKAEPGAFLAIFPIYAFPELCQKTALFDYLRFLTLPEIDK